MTEIGDVVAAEVASSRPAVLKPAASRWQAARFAGAGVGASCVLAFVLAVHGLGDKPIWIDEAASISTADRALPNMLRVFRNIDAQAALYDVLLHWWLRLGDSEAWTRGLSVLFAVGAVGATGWCAWRWRGPVAAVAASFVLATNSFWLFYAQEVRPYSLTLLLAALSTGTLIAAVERPDRRRRVRYCVVTVLLVYANLFALLFVGTQALVLAMQRHGKPLVTAWVAIGACSAPLAVYMAVYEHEQVSWIVTPSIHDLIRSVGRFAEQKFGVAMVVALGAVVLLAKRRGERHLMTFPIIGSAALPFAVLWMASHIHPLYVERYLMASLAAIVMVVGAGVADLADRRLSAVGIGVTAAFGLLGVTHDREYFDQSYKVEDGRSAVAFIESQARAGDVIVYTHSGDRLPLDYYFSRSAFGTRPADIAVDTEQHVIDEGLIFPEEVDHATRDQLLAGAARVWVVDRPVDGEAISDVDLLSTLESRTDPGESRSFGQITVTLWSSPAI